MRSTKERLCCDGGTSRKSDKYLVEKDLIADIALFALYMICEIALANVEFFPTGYKVPRK